VRYSKNQKLRCLRLPGHGIALISTDLHGNGEDYRRLRDIFLTRASKTPDVHWVLLGDVVHGPNDEARSSEPSLYDYLDASVALIEDLIELTAAYPRQIHLLLGNHEHAHIGGPRTAKFHPDEAAFLEEGLAPNRIARLRAFFQQAALFAVAPCGVLLCHGSPGAALVGNLSKRVQLEDPSSGRVDLTSESRDNSLGQSEVLTTCLTSYGQPAEVSASVLEAVSAIAGLSLHLVIHGHDRDEDGWFTEGGNQLCPVIFGAPRQKKRYLELDLAARYRSLDQIRDGIELRRLHGQATP
jgi:hypothetical protein